MAGIELVLWVVVPCMVAYLGLALHVVLDWLRDTRMPLYKGLGENFEDRIEAWLRIRYGEFVNLAPGERMLTRFDAIVPFLEARFLLQVLRG